MLTGLYYEAGNDSKILELPKDHVSYMNHTIIQSSDNLKSVKTNSCKNWFAEFHLYNMIFMKIKEQNIGILSSFLLAEKIFKLSLIY